MLQVCVASHPRVCSFPETFFFEKAVGRYAQWLARLDLPTGESRTSLWRTLAEIGRPDLGYLIPPGPLRFGEAARCFVALLDQSALDEGHDVWVEKTPMHVHRIDLIERHVPDPVFIHMLRDGRDVVTSLVERARRFPERFGDQRDPAFGIERWNAALDASVQHFGRPRHHFVSYEAVTERSEKTLQRLFVAVGLADAGQGDDPSGEDATRRAAESVVPEGRPWIHAAKRAPEPRASRFREVFDARTANQIERRLNLHRYRSLLGRMG